MRPGVANFVLAEFDPAGPKSAAAAYDHLAGQGIFGRRVSEYGLPDHLRFTVGLEEGKPGRRRGARGLPDLGPAGQRRVFACYIGTRRNTWVQAECLARRSQR